MAATATHHGASTTTADGSAIGSGAAVGAAIALAFVDDSAIATPQRNITAGGNVIFEAHTDGSSAVLAKASAAGAPEKTSGSANDQGNKQAGLANQKTGGSKSTGSKAKTSKGGVGVGAALALNIATSEAIATITDGLTIKAGFGAGTGSLQLRASNNMDASAKADGKAKTSGTGSAIGVGVAINIATMTNEASVGVGSVVESDGLVVEALMKSIDDGPGGTEAVHAFVAAASSGASGGKIGVAGSVGINIANTSTLAVVGLDHDPMTAPHGAALLTLGGGDVSLKAENTTENTAFATPAGPTGGSKVGVGVSVAVNIAVNDTIAEVKDGTSSAGKFEVTSTSLSLVNTTAASGVTGTGTSIGGSVTITVVENSTYARIGTAAGGNPVLSLNGNNLRAQATHSNTVVTLADSEVAGGGVGVGVSIALNIVTDTTEAAVKRSFVSVSSIDVTADSTILTSAEAKASVTGASQNKILGDDTSDEEDDADQETANQTSYAQGQGDMDPATSPKPSENASGGVNKGDSQSSSQSGKKTGGGGSSGKVSVAASIAVNYMDADNTALIADGVVITAGGAMKVEATSVTDASAVATAAATNATSKTGVAAAIVVNIALANNTAKIGATANVQATSVSVKAVTATGDKNSIKARALAGGVGSQTAIGGSIAVNVVEIVSEASIGNGAQVNATAGSINVQASTHTEIQNITGGAALSLSGTGVGIAVSVNVVDKHDTIASIGNNVNADATGSIDVGATASFTPMRTESLPVLGEIEVTSFAAGVAATGGGAAIGGSSSVNVIFMETRASVGTAADLDAGGDISVTAADVLTVFTGAGSLGVSLGSAGVGIGLDVQVIDRDTTATVSAGADLDETGGNITVSATALDMTTSIAATVGVSTSSAGVSGSISVVVFTSDTEAVVGLGADLRASGDVSVTAKSDADIFLLAGGLAFGVSAGVGIASTVLVHTDNVRAEIVGNSIINTGGGVGLTVSAISTDDVLTIAAAGGGSASSAAIAAAIVVNVLNETTLARLGGGSTVTAQSGGNNPGVAVLATDDTEVLSIAGALGISGGSAGVGAGVDVGVITKTTEAAVGASTVINADGNVTVEAGSSEDISSFAAAAGASSSAGVTVTANVHVLTLTTRASIGASANVHALGSVLVQAHDQTEIDLIVGGVAIGGSAGVGAAVGVAVITKVTDAFIGAGAIVVGEGNSTVSARTGRFGVIYTPETQEGAGDVDPGDGSRPTKADLEVRLPSGNQFSDLDDDGTDDTSADQSLSGQRVATATTDASFRGVAVSATSQDDVETLALSVGGGGSVGVAVGAAVNVVDVDTTASIGAAPQINQTGGAHASQSVLVAAASDFNHVGVGAGAAFVGSRAAAPGVDVSVIDVTTSATINDNTDVKAADDVVVVATAKEKILIVSAGLAISGTISLAGGVTVLPITGNTTARIGANATVDAGGNVVVAAKDDTTFTVISGAVGLGFGGGGAAGSVGVTTIDKNTAATIGNGAIVDAKGLNGTVADVLNGDINTVSGEATGFDDFDSEAGRRGVIVQAESSEKATHIAVAGAGGLYVGLAGGVTVTLIDSDTTADIGANAKINQALNNSSADSSQGVYVNASNETQITSFAGGIDYGSVKNDTTASIGTGSNQAVIASRCTRFRSRSWTPSPSAAPAAWSAWRRRSPSGRSARR